MGNHWQLNKNVKMYKFEITKTNLSLPSPSALRWLHEGHFVAVFPFFVPTVRAGLGLVWGLFLSDGIAAFVLGVWGFAFVGALLWLSFFCLTVHCWGGKRLWLRLRLRIKERKWVFFLRWRFKKHLSTKSFCLTTGSQMSISRVYSYMGPWTKAQPVTFR